MTVAILAGQRSVTHYATSSTDTLHERVGMNTGNTAFVTAVADHVADDVVFVSWAAAPESLVDADVVVVPCANQFGAHTDMSVLADLLEKAGKPVVAVGLGAQAAAQHDDVVPSEGTMRWVSVMQDLRATDAPNILVRGRYSREQLARHGVTSVEVVGCPSLFLSPATDLGKRVERAATDLVDPLRVAVLAGHSGAKGLADVDRVLFRAASGSLQGLPWIVQEELALIELTRGREVHPETAARMSAHYAPDLDAGVFAEWVRSNGVTFFDIEPWMEHSQRFEVTVGPRFHGAMLALQAGTPAVVVTHDSRTEELVETTGIPSVAAEDVVSKGVTRAWEAARELDGDTFDRNRRSLAATYRSLLEANGVAVTPLLRRLAG